MKSVDMSMMLVRPGSAVKCNPNSLGVNCTVVNVYFCGGLLDSMSMRFVGEKIGCSTRPPPRSRPCIELKLPLAEPKRKTSQEVPSSGQAAPVYRNASEP